MARIKKYKMNPIPKAISEKGGFSAQFLSDGNSVDGETEILPGVIADGGFKIAPEIAQRLFDKYFAACLNYGARTGENVKVGASGHVLMSIRGWYSNKDSKAKKDNVRILFRLANEIRPTAVFTLSNVNEGATLMLVSVTTEGCSLDHVKAGEKATINGKYTKMLEGDKVTAKVGEGDAKIEAECEIVESGDQFIDIVVPEIFRDAALDGKEIVFTVEGRCGDEEAGTQTKEVTATLIVDATPVEPKIVSVVGTNSGQDGVMKKLTDGITINVEGCSLEGAEAQLILRDQNDGHKLADTKFGDPSGNAVFTVKSATEATFYMSSNTTSQPDGSWTTGNGGEVALQIKLADGTIIEYPIVIVA